MPYKDKDKQKEFQRQHYKDNKQVYKERCRKRRRDQKEWFFENVLKDLKCDRCVETHPWCLEFHHLDPTTKIATVSSLVRGLRSRQIILDEVSKCICLCANCHRKLHHEEFMKNRR